VAGARCKGERSGDLDADGDGNGVHKEKCLHLNVGWIRMTVRSMSNWASVRASGWATGEQGNVAWLPGHVRFQRRASVWGKSWRVRGYAPGVVGTEGQG
jgi:hypothetical protein